MAGHDRFVADLRPLFERRRAGGAALCCHPYDLCTELIARELGVLVTDEHGSTLDAPLDVTSDVGWIGYANAALKALVEPHLRHALTRARTDRLTRPLRTASAVPQEVPDLERFAADVAARMSARQWPRSAAVGGGDSVFVARAPGRLDVMGGIADYSGALVLQWPIREATRVAAAAVGRTPSLDHIDLDTAASSVIVTSRWISIADAHRSYDEVRAWFGSDPARHWAAYVAGVFHVLSREHGVQFRNGAAILIESDVPEGKGVSSSAAIEAATMEAVVEAWRMSIEPKMRAVRCQQVENLIVGAPCGVMDQMASICGEAAASWRCSVSPRSSGQCAVA